MKQQFKTGPGKARSPHFNTSWVSNKTRDFEVKPRMLRFTPAPEWMQKPLKPPAVMRTHEKD